MPSGHSDTDKEKNTATKTCGRCGEDKPLADFHRRSDDPKGRQVRSTCIECWREQQREGYERRRAAMDPEEINPPGRPTRDTEHVRELLSYELSSGKLLTEIIKDNPELPDYQTIMKWWLGIPGDGHDLFRSVFAQARKAQIENWLEKAWAELWDPRDDWVWHERKKDYVPDKFSPMRMKELLQHTRWMAERVLPTLYGSRVQIDHNHTSQQVPTEKRIDWSQLDVETIRKVRAAMIEPGTSDEQKEPPRLVGEGSASSEDKAGQVIEQKEPGSESSDSG